MESPEVIRELIGNGAQIDMQANDGYSAIIAASQNGHLDVVRELIGKGAQIDMQTNDGYSALIAGQSKWTSGCSQRTDWKGCSDRHANK